jgi:hypothetical protein
MRRVFFTLGIVLFAGIGYAQLPPEINIKRASGQNIQPVFEGWEEQPDGRISIWFGYFNRNYEEQLDIPVGPLNTVDFTPNGDSGQPTHFYPRRQKFLFKIDVPANFDKTKRIIWSVTAAGQKLAAVGWLQPEWEIDNGTRMENNGGAPDLDNKPPTITGIGDQTVAIGKPLKLTASATDDGLPKPPPELPHPTSTTVPVTAGFGGKRARGVTITWVVVRNPATGGEATFNPDSSGAPVYGKPVESATSVTFSEPGTYWLRAVASDTSLEATHDIKVTVSPR